MWRDRAFASGLASRTVRVKQHPGRAGEDPPIVNIGVFGLRALSSFTLTFNIVLPQYSSAVLTVDCRFRRRPLVVVKSDLHGLEIPNSLFLRTAGLT